VPGIDAQIIEFIVEPNDRITKNPIKDIHFPHDAIIGAIMRGDEIIIPKGDTRITGGDRVVVFSLPGAMASVDKLFK